MYFRNGNEIISRFCAENFFIFAARDWAHAELCKHFRNKIKKEKVPQDWSFISWTFLLVCVVLTFTPSVYAAPPTERWFEVELIVFENLNPSALYEEKWPKEISLPNYNNSLFLTSPPLFPNLDQLELASDITMISPTKNATSNVFLVSFQKLPEDLWRLHQEFKQLKKSKKYAPLFHTAWMQSIVDNTTAKKFHIEFPASKQIQPQENITQPNSQTDNEFAPMIEGTVHFHKARFYHLELHLIYRREVPIINDPYQQNTPSEESEIKYQPFVIDEKRNRVHSKVIHYFDHPMFGALVLITRYKNHSKLMRIMPD